MEENIELEVQTVVNEDSLEELCADDTIVENENAEEDE
jgi:hypothetical protein